MTPEPLNVAPELVGQPLAPPARRAFAMGVDLLVVSLLSGVSGVWLAAGVALVVVQLRSQRLAGWKAVLGWLLAALLLALAVSQARERWDGRHDPPEAEVADIDTAPLKQAGLTDAQRIALLEAALADAQKARPPTLESQLESLLDAVGLSFGWGFVYFSLLPAWWGGQTLGKKLFGLKVVELTGQPMTVMRCLRRYGGYAAGMATGGLGFLQALWDVNCQGIQDRTAHTVVLDLRAPPVKDQAASS